MARGHEGGAIGAEDPACRIERQQALITQVTGIAALSQHGASGIALVETGVFDEPGVQAHQLQRQVLRLLRPATVEARGIETAQQRTLWIEQRRHRATQHGVAAEKVLVPMDDQRLARCQPRTDAVGPYQRLIPATADHQPRIGIGAVLPGQPRVERDTAAVTEQHREPGRIQTPRQPFHALARDGQKVMMLFLMQTDLVMLKLNVGGRLSRVKSVLVDTAVPGFGNQPIRVGSSVGKVRGNECREFGWKL